MNTITIAGRAVRVLHLALAGAAVIVALAVALAGGHGTSAAGASSSGPPASSAAAYPGDTPGMAACIASRIANGVQSVEYGNMPGSLTVAQGEARQFCSMGRAFSATTTPDGAGPDATNYNGG